MASSKTAYITGGDRGMCPGGIVIYHCDAFADIDGDTGGGDIFI